MGAAATCKVKSLAFKRLVLKERNFVMLFHEQNILVSISVAIIFCQINNDDVTFNLFDLTVKCAAADAENDPDSLLHFMSTSVA